MTPLRQATVGRQSRSLMKRRTLPQPPTLQALSPDSATAFMEKVLHRKNSSPWYGTGMELSQTHTHACPLPSQASSRHPKRAISFRRRPSSLQAHSLQKLLIRRSSHVIQILTYSDFASLYPLPRSFFLPFPEGKSAQSAACSGGGNFRSDPH